ncbi:hypothetical protein PFICI_08927 [Pestalotiopsis fici W106-1]|uniref:Uncharacterized protein n=1 Tax=Pestalotiopsis fici (strain W106-1 / CGMCC3.15140) TaxID=1229662 RepID=W3WZ65_PESFW|nr:uncharacterized protein PFICI_08927 [Pestalotiopsis fici W106-1]ETS79074.1 hypothetical protein PFICI_08927 [Pestalotiopsis fici W106-1]
MSTTAPVVVERFASANGDFYAESSGNNRHRRATTSELKEHFASSGSSKDKPAHWYEAQLIHYGLQPSKTKSVAFKRLFDASNTGNLSVPAHITKLEADLKKEWTKRDREAKKEAKGQMVGVTKTTEKATAVKKTTAGTKRKASETLDVTVSVGGIDFKMSASNSSASQSTTAKKTKTATASAAKTTKAAAATSKPVKESPKAKPTPKTTKTTAAPPKTTKATPAPKEKKPVSKATPKEKKTPAKAAPKAKTAPKTAANSSQPSANWDAAATSASSPAQSRPKQTARRGGLSQGSGRGGTASAAAATDPPRPRTKQTARRGGGFPAYGGHGHSFASQNYEPYGYGDYDSEDDNDDNDDDDEPPPPYSEYGRDGSLGSSDDDDGPLAKLGLLNGRYEIESADVSEQWPRLGDDLSLVLTLAGDQLWGQFELGVYEGVLRFDVRPYESSYEALPYSWRGRETGEGEIIYGDSNQGWIKFLGGGRIKGYLDHMSIHFSGRRIPGQSTRSEVDIGTMRDQWNNEYSEREYERANRARWGGSSW